MRYLVALMLIVACSSSTDPNAVHCYNVQHLGFDANGYPQIQTSCVPQTSLSAGEQTFGTCRCP